MIDHSSFPLFSYLSGYNLSELQMLLCGVPYSSDVGDHR